MALGTRPPSARGAGQRPRRARALAPPSPPSQTGADAPSCVRMVSTLSLSDIVVAISASTSTPLQRAREPEEPQATHPSWPHRLTASNERNRSRSRSRCPASRLRLQPLRWLLRLLLLLSVSLPLRCADARAWRLAEPSAAFGGRRIVASQRARGGNVVMLEAFGALRPPPPACDSRSRIDACVKAEPMRRASAPPSPRTSRMHALPPSSSAAP